MLGTAFAIIVVKQLYGGLGHNLFNPAMAAYVLLLISYPQQMTSWLPPTTLQHHAMTGADPVCLVFSGFSCQGFSVVAAQSRCGRPHHGHGAGHPAQ